MSAITYSMRYIGGGIFTVGHYAADEPDSPWIIESSHTSLYHAGARARYLNTTNDAPEDPTRVLRPGIVWGVIILVIAIWLRWLLTHPHP